LLKKIGVFFEIRMMMEERLKIFSEENLLEQLQHAPYQLGYYTVEFCTKDGRPTEVETETVEVFYLYPSGGTLRDKNFNIIFYSSKFDTYRGFIPPHKNREEVK